VFSIGLPLVDTECTCISGRRFAGVLNLDEFEFFPIRWMVYQLGNLYRKRGGRRAFRRPETRKKDRQGDLTLDLVSTPGLLTDRGLRFMKWVIHLTIRGRDPFARGEPLRRTYLSRGVAECRYSGFAIEWAEGFNILRGTEWLQLIERKLRSVSQVGRDSCRAVLAGRQWCRKTDSFPREV
jgi:hypothetical protein